jgi:hypothetical protein
MSNDELDGCGLVARPPRRPNRRVRRAITWGALVVVIGLVGWSIVWAFTGIHGGGPAAWQYPGHSTACAPNPRQDPGDVMMALGIGTLGSYRIAEVRLIGAHGVSLVEADVGVVSLGADGNYRLSVLQAGWPGLAGGTVAADSLVPAVGATVQGLDDHALVLHLHVDDPTVESGFRDVGIVYRAGGTRYEQRLEYTQRLIPGRVCQMG